MPDREDWAIVELMGHVRIAGKLSEEERFGGKLGRLDIPTAEGFVSQFFGAASVYRITIVTEAVARHVAATTISQPVSPWDFPKQLPAPTSDELADRVMSCGHTPEDCDCDPDDDEDDDSPY